MPSGGGWEPVVPRVLCGRGREQVVPCVVWVQVCVVVLELEARGGTRRRR